MADTPGSRSGLRGRVLQGHGVLRRIRKRHRDAVRFAGRITAIRRSEPAAVSVNVLLAVALLLTTVSVAYAMSLPDNRGQYTEFGVLTRDDSGKLVADDYPRDIERGSSVPLVFSIENHERVGSKYTVVVQLQRVSFDDGRVEAVRESRTLSRNQIKVAPGTTRHVPYEFSPTMVGEDLRVSFLLYRGSPPSDPDAGNAYRELHLWVDVSTDAGVETAEDAG